MLALFSEVLLFPKIMCGTFPEACSLLKGDKSNLWLTCLNFVLRLKMIMAQLILFVLVCFNIFKYISRMYWSLCPFLVIRNSERVSIGK